MINKRRFRRVTARMSCRPTGLGPRLDRPRQPVDVSLGGARIQLQEPAEPGTRMEMDLFLPDASVLTCVAEVVWVEPLPAGAPARFDAGVQFAALSAEDRARLELVLEKPGPLDRLRRLFG